MQASRNAEGCVLKSRPRPTLVQRFGITVTYSWSPCDRGIDCDLIQPARMDRGEDRDECGPSGLEPLTGAVENPKDAGCRTVGGPAPDIGDQPVEGGDPRLRLIPPETTSLPHIPGRQVRQRPTALVFMLDPAVAPRGGRREG